MMNELSLLNCRLDRRYDIERRLGQGSYAEIFVASDRLATVSSPHRIVVIKALNLRLQEELDPQLERTLIENFQNEAIALDRVRHPNVIARLGHGTARDLDGTVFHYLVLEHMPGGDLQQLIKTDTLPIGRILSYLEQAAAGLDNAHRHGIIHRDIKPQNLLLDATRSIVKIADFGVARMTTGEAPITRVGTNLYAPPEHSPLGYTNASTAQYGSITPASDVYSFAKTAYCLIAGRAPRDLSGRPIEDLSDVDIDERFRDRLGKALRAATDDEPSRRQQSIIQLWNDIRDAFSSIDDDEAETIVRRRGTDPQPRVSRGFTPLPPDRPDFETIVGRSPALVLDVPEPEPYRPPSMTAQAEMRIPAIPASGRVPGGNAVNVRSSNATVPTGKVPPRKKRRILRKLIAALLVIGISAGALYYAAALVTQYVPEEIASFIFPSRSATATTDIYLRPAPNANNDPIGLVTKNSKVRIISSQNNWHQVDIIEQGRTPQSNMPNATRGWVNGKYLTTN